MNDKPKQLHSQQAERNLEEVKQKVSHIEHELTESKINETKTTSAPTSKTDQGVASNITESPEKFLTVGVIVAALFLLVFLLIYIFTRATVWLLLILLVIIMFLSDRLRR